MCLYAICEIVETGGVGDLGGRDAAGKVRDAVGDEVPDAVELFGCGFWRRFYGMALFYERVEVDHFDVVVKGGEDMMSRHS